MQITNGWTLTQEEFSPPFLPISSHFPALSVHPEYVYILYSMSVLFFSSKPPVHLHISREPHVVCIPCGVHPMPIFCIAQSNARQHCSASAQCLHTHIPACRCNAWPQQPAQLGRQQRKAALGQNDTLRFVHREGGQQADLCSFMKIRGSKWEEQTNCLIETGRGVSKQVGNTGGSICEEGGGRE